MIKLILIITGASLLISSCGEPLTAHEREMREIDRQIKAAQRQVDYHNKHSDKGEIEAGRKTIYTYRRDALPTVKMKSLLEQSDDYETNKDRFNDEAQDYYRLGFCGTQDFEDVGGFIKSNRYQNTYFIWCGGDQFLVHLDNEFEQIGIEP